MQLFVGTPGQTLCQSFEQNCFTSISESLIDETSEIFKSCDCLPDCNSIEFTYVRVVSRLATENAEDYVEVNGTIPLEASAAIYFGSEEYSGFKRYASYSTVSLLSNIGGFLGLFLGVSLLSVIETIYFFTLRFFNDLWF